MVPGVLVFKGVGKVWIFMFLGGTGGGQKWKRIFEKTRVGFGRTELSLRLSCTEFCALSSGHGPRNPRFRRFLKILDFHDFSKSLQRLEK